MRGGGEPDFTAADAAARDAAAAAAAAAMEDAAVSAPFCGFSCFWWSRKHVEHMFSVDGVPKNPQPLEQSTLGAFAFAVESLDWFSAMVKAQGGGGERPSGRREEAARPQEIKGTTGLPSAERKRKTEAIGQHGRQHQAAGEMLAPGVRKPATVTSASTTNKVQGSGCRAEYTVAPLHAGHHTHASVLARWHAAQPPHPQI